MYITEFPYPDHVMADRIPTLEPNVNNINYFDETEFILDITKENSNMPKLISQFTELENDMPPLIINETSVKDLPTHLELPFLTQTPIITKTEVKPITTRLTKYVSLPVNDNIEDEASESNKYLKQIYNSYLEILSTQYNILKSVFCKNSDMPPEYTLIQAIELFRIYRAQKNVINKNHTWLDKYSPQNSKKYYR